MSCPGEHPLTNGKADESLWSLLLQEAARIDSSPDGKTSVRDLLQELHRNGCRLYSNARGRLKLDLSSLFESLNEQAGKRATLC